MAGHRAENNRRDRETCNARGRRGDQLPQTQSRQHEHERRQPDLRAIARPAFLGQQVRQIRQRDQRDDRDEANPFMLSLVKTQRQPGD